MKSEKVTPLVITMRSTIPKLERIRKLSMGSVVTPLAAALMVNLIQTELVLREMLNEISGTRQ